MASLLEPKVPSFTLRTCCDASFHPMLSFYVLGFRFSLVKTFSPNVWDSRRERHHDCNMFCVFILSPRVSSSHQKWNPKRQDHAREEKITEFEEEKQRTFIPSAVGVPLKPLFRCDKQCSEKTLSYWQLASVVVNEGDEAYTCQKCVNTHLQAKGEEPLTNVKWREGVSGKNVENDGERAISARDVGTFLQ